MALAGEWREQMTYYGLSKSKIAAFEQCAKRLWLSVHKPEEAVYDAATNAKFATGHAVGDLACEMYPDGILIEAVPTLQAAIEKTVELLFLDPPRPLFEATFRHQGVLVRVDLMIPSGDGRWHVAEVKSSTSAKAYQLNDLAIQLWVMEGCGVPIASASIRHIDNGFVYALEGDYRGLLKDSGPSDAMADLIASRADVVSGALAALQGGEPELACGDHCHEPFSCPFVDHCHRDIALPAWPITLLPYSGKQLARKWEEQGKVDLAEIAEHDLTTELHRRIHRATVDNVAFHDIEGAKIATAEWAAPMAYLDFETIAFAVPRWIGTRPYQAIPFQFSAHVEDKNGSLVHHQFLDCSGSDPRRPCAEALIKVLPRDGSIIAYNASFERSRIQELASFFPDLTKALKAIAARIVDLLPIARSHYYHRDQRGSWSIKSVLPTLAPELDYGALDVGDGGAAQLAFEEAIDAATNTDRKAALEQALLQYCALDTWAMVVLRARLCGLGVPPNIVLAAAATLG